MVCMAGNEVLRCNTVALPPDIDVFDFVGGHRPLTWIQNGTGLVGHGQALRVELDAGVDCFAAAQKLLGELSARVEVHDEVGQPGTGPVVFVSFAFDPEAGASVLIVPELVVGRADGAAWLTSMWVKSASAQSGRPVKDVSTRPLSWACDKASWTTGVTRVTEAIERGVVRKVVLARSEMMNVQVCAGDLVRRLGARFPSCYIFSVDGLIGATPELLLGRRGEQVQSLVLAGSARPSEDSQRTRADGHALLNSAKDRNEHTIAVDSVVDVHRKLCADVRVDDQPFLLRLPNILHLATSVRSTLPTGRSTLELVARLQPTAAVCGTPRATALKLIRQWEGGLRGRYCGPVGWFDLAGNNADVGIALRCAELTSDGFRLFAGAGIVAGSDPDSEYAETELKLNAMRSVLEAT